MINEKKKKEQKTRGCRPRLLLSGRLFGWYSYGYKCSMAECKKAGMLPNTNYQGISCDPLYDSQMRDIVEVSVGQLLPRTDSLIVQHRYSLKSLQSWTSNELLLVAKAGDQKQLRCSSMRLYRLLLVYSNNSGH